LGDVTASKPFALLSEIDIHRKHFLHLLEAKPQHLFVVTFFRLPDVFLKPDRDVHTISYAHPGRYHPACIYVYYDSFVRRGIFSDFHNIRALS
jgi:hypothetical protein